MVDKSYRTCSTVFKLATAVAAVDKGTADMRHGMARERKPWSVAGHTICWHVPRSHQSNRDIMQARWRSGARKTDTGRRRSIFTGCYAVCALPFRLCARACLIFHNYRGQLQNV